MRPFHSSRNASVDVWKARASALLRNWRESCSAHHERKEVLKTRVGSSCRQRVTGARRSLWRTWAKPRVTMSTALGTGLSDSELDVPNTQSPTRSNIAIAHHSRPGAAHPFLRDCCFLKACCFEAWKRFASVAHRRCHRPFWPCIFCVQWSF